MLSVIFPQIVSFPLIFSPFLIGFDWDNLCRSPPPMKPSASLNLPTQNEIGNFLDDKLNKNIILTEEDQSMYDHWEFLSRRSFQEEIVEFLIIEEKLVSTLPVCMTVSGTVCVSVCVRRFI